MKKKIILFLFFFLFSCWENILEEKTNYKVNLLEENKFWISYFNELNNESYDLAFKNIFELNKFLEKFEKKINFISFYEWKVDNNEILEILEILKWFEDITLKIIFSNINEEIFFKLSEFNSKNLNIFLWDISWNDNEKIEISEQIWKKFLENKNIELVNFDTINWKSFILIDKNWNETYLIYDWENPKIFTNIYNFASKNRDESTIKIYKKLEEKYYKNKKVSDF